MEIDCKPECIRRRHCLEYITEFSERYPYYMWISCTMYMHRLLRGENDYSMSLRKLDKVCAWLQVEIYTHYT